MALQGNKQFKLFLIRGTIFLIVFFAVDFIVGGIMRIGYFSQKNKYTYGIRQTNADVIVLGSSHALHHYVPSIISDSLGMSCFNMGSGGQNIYYHYAVISSIMERYTPKIIIMDLIYVDYEVTGSEHNTNKLNILLPYLKDNKAVKEVIRLRGPFERLKLVSRIYPFNSQINEILYSFIKSDRNSYLSMNGYIPLFGEFIQPRITYENRNIIQIDPLKVQYIEKVISLCKRHNVRLIMVNSPLLYRYGEVKALSNEVIKGIADKYGIEFWNYENDTTFLKPENFFDADHLNDIGAKKYTKAIVTRIKNNL
jgi:hypothetical protein